MREILDHFLIPIETSSEKKEVSANLYDDLELLKCHDKSSDSSSFYHKLFNPKGNAGKLIVEKLSKYYTSEKHFLEDSQKLYKKCHSFTNDIPLCQDAWDLWNKTKKDSNFHEKYQYIDIEKGKWLNHSAIFLLVLTFYSILSPLLNILAPFLLLLIPFIILKIMKIPITAASYTKILLEQLDKHSFGQLFTRFWEVPFSQRIYLLMCFGMYIYNIYQNVISCYQFYRNTYFINTYFQKMTTYIKHTKKQLEQFISLLSPFKSYRSYENYLKGKLKDIDILHKTLYHIPNARFNPVYLNSMGYVMKQFYIMNTSKPIADLLYFTFGFNGYVDTLSGLSQQIIQKTLRPAKIVNSKKNIVQFKDTFYPLIKGDIVKNDIDLKKNIMITGPNAAGKTTLLKTVILNILITQQIGFGFYRKAKLTPFHFIHCYLNIPDTSSRDSLFQAEARRCGKILQLINNNPQQKHFCIFDELYSGTNPFEAIASAYGYLNYLNKKPNISFMLTTHFIRLCNLFDKQKHIRNYNMETTINDDNIPSYTYKLTTGISKIKGGICVLKNLGYPQDILTKTQEIMGKL